jgi:hypothetical protein
MAPRGGGEVFASTKPLTALNDGNLSAEWPKCLVVLPLFPLIAMIGSLSDPCKLSGGWRDKSSLADEQQQRPRSGRQLHCLTHTFEVCCDNAFTRQAGIFDDHDGRVGTKTMRLQLARNVLRGGLAHIYGKGCLRIGE